MISRHNNLTSLYLGEKITNIVSTMPRWGAFSQRAYHSVLISSPHHQKRMNSRNLKKMNSKNLEWMNSRNLKKMNSKNLEWMNSRNLKRMSSKNLEWMNSRNHKSMKNRNVQSTRLILSYCADFSFDKHW